MARIIQACDNSHNLFALRSALYCGNSYFAGQARRALRDMSIETDDLTVASVASKLSRPVRIYVPTHGGDAA